MIIAGRGVPRGARTDALCEFVDVMPTLLETTGVAAPPGLEGVSLSPLFADADRPWKAAAFSQYPRDGDRTGGLSLMGDAVRTDRYRYVCWTDRDTGKIVAEELYDHARRVLPARNLAEDPEQVVGLADARRLLNAGWKRVQDGVRVP
ncbi:MAG: sulfatase/phosphatase domain-containing protein [Planctomycetota bacterium]